MIVLFVLMTNVVLKAQNKTDEEPAGLAFYTSAVSTSFSGTSTSCSGDKFTLTLTNVSDNAGNDKLAHSIGSVIVKVPAGITIADFTSIEVSDSWTINKTDYPDEIRFKSNDNLSNAVSSFSSKSTDNKLVISFSVALLETKKLIWKTSVFKSADWQAANRSVSADFALATLTNGVTAKSSNYPSVTIHTLPVINLASSEIDNTVCAGELVTFTASVSNNVPVSAYEFFVDGESRQMSPSDKYTMALKDGQKVSVKVITAGGCSVSHEGITTTVNPSPTASFMKDKMSFCPGENALLPISLTGKAPWLLMYKVGDVRKQITIEAGEVNDKVYNLEVKSSVSTTFTLLNISDASACSASINTMAQLVISKPTAILSQPLSQEVCEKEQVDFTVSAEGSDLIYQWRKNGVNIVGATASSFTIPAASVHDSNASFDVVVSGACGVVTATPAMLVVNQLTAINKQPASLEICENLQVTFNVEAVGIKLTYQWYKGSVKEENKIKEATNAAYIINQVSLADAGEYVVVVSGACGEVTSYPATLIVNPKPVFGEFAFSEDGNLLQAPAIEVNSSLAIEISLGGKELEHLHYTLVGYGKSVPLFPEYNFDTGKLSTIHGFTAEQAGVYLLTASATNNCGTSTKSYRYVIVANPNGSFITGDGSVSSPVNTQYFHMSSSGKATYDFKAKYKQGTTQVEGYAEFNVEAGNMHFKSNVLDDMRLVVGGNTASFTGKGTINGGGNYGFLLSAVDGSENREDKLRMLIWTIQADGSTGKAVYDSQAYKEKADGEEVQASTKINNGSIVIHKSHVAPVNAVAYTPVPAEFEEPEQVMAYPNPFENKVDVDLSKFPSENITLTVVDASGLVVYQKNFSATSVISKVEVDLSGVQAGMYFLQTKRGQELTTTKLYKF